MTIEQRIEKLEKQMKRINELFLDSQRSNTQTVARVDGNSNDIVSLTPFTATQIGYYGETEKTFYNVPDGNVTVFGLKEYSLDRISDRLTITFDALSEQTEITISIS